MTQQAPNSPSIEEQILREIKKTNKILTLANGLRLEEEIGKYATTDERKKIWVLINGVRQAPEIAQIIGKTKRAVDVFLQALEDAELVERAHGKPPRRIIDYIPASWVELLSSKQARLPEEGASAPASSEQIPPSSGENQNG